MTIRTLITVGVIAVTTSVASTYPQQRIRGRWSDACPCEVSCSCWADRKSNVRRCINFHFFEILEGSDHGVDLTGVRMVLLNVANIDYSAPTPAVLYLGNKLSPDQISSAQQVINALFGYVPVTRIVEIKSKTSERFQTVNVPGLLEYEIEDRGDSINARLSRNLYPWLSGVRQWRVRHVRHAKQPAKKYSNTNALIGEFSIKVQ